MPICIVILGAEDPFIYQEKEEDEEVMVLASEYGLYATNTIPVFKNRKKSNFIIYKIDDHPNAKANKIFADVIYNYLKNQHIIY